MRRHPQGSLASTETEAFTYDPSWRDLMIIRFTAHAVNVDRGICLTLKAFQSRHLLRPAVLPPEICPSASLLRGELELEDTVKTMLSCWLYICMTNCICQTHTSLALETGIHRWMFVAKTVWSETDRPRSLICMAWLSLCLSSETAV